MNIKNNRITFALIKFFERFLRTDVSYLLTGGFWLTIGKGVNMTIAFFLSILYANYLPQEIYGDYRYIGSTLGLLGAFTLSGMVTAMRRSIARGYDKTFLRASFFIFISYAVVGVAALVIGVVLYLQGRVALGWGFMIAAFLLPFAEGLGTWRGYFESKRQFRKKTLFNIVSHLGYGASMSGAVLVSAFFAFSASATLFVLVGAYFFAQALPNAVFFIRAAREVIPTAKEEKGALRYGVLLSILNVPSTAANYIDAVLLHYFLGPVALAVYSFSIVPVEQLKALTESFLTASFPKLSLKTGKRAHWEDVRATLPRKIGKASLISGAVTLVYVFAAPFLYTFFFPPYQESIRFSQVFALSFALYPFSIFRSALKAEGNMKKIYFNELIAPIIQIAALVMLIPSFGLWGAIAGRIIGRFANYFISFFIFISKL